MLFYRYISEFNVDLNIFDQIELILWIVVCIMMFVLAVLFYKDSQELNKLFKFISLFLLLFIGSRIARIIAHFIHGEPPVDPTQFPTTLVQIQIIYNMFSYIGLFFLYYTLEKSILKKTHFLFCGMVIFCTVLSFINYMITDPELYQMFFLLIMLVYLICLIGIPLVFLNLARKTHGKIRTNALLVAFGIVLFCLSVVFDIPEARPLLINLGETMMSVLRMFAPIMAIIGLLLIRKGFPREI